MLSELEMEKLVNRRDQTPRDRATNDMRVRRKLSVWLDNISDADTILNILPADQLRDKIDDTSIFLLLDIVWNLMKIKNFRTIVGTKDEPTKWKTKAISESDEVNMRPAPDKAAEKLDIARSSMLLLGFSGMFRYLGSENPIISVVDQWKNLYKPGYLDKLEAGERQSIEKVLDALKGIYEIDLAKK